MNRTLLWMPGLILLMGFSFAVTAGKNEPGAFTRESANANSCTAAEYRQFDFWVGDWDVFEAEGGEKVAHVRVDRMLDGCTLREDYQGTNGLRGQSFSIYDASRKVWHQTWVTSRGQLLAIEGGKTSSGEMILAGSYLDSSGSETMVRGTWRKEQNGVRETAVTSANKGASWKPWFDLTFRPGKEGSEGADERKTVADLDTQYQDAVKRNDADAMGRILADDFILVTGSGKTHTKADLLEEARSAKFRYEHQEDTEQTVRIWGDTAVVTAKLWVKGSRDGKAADYTLWFSDTYVRTPAGWRYVFGQASLPLPKK